MSDQLEATISRIFVARATGYLPPELANDLIELLRNRQGQSDLLRAKEAANFLRVSQRTLRDWNRSGNGPPRQQVGRVSLYSRRALEGWIANSKPLPDTR